jgi:hypothetical protein
MGTEHDIGHCIYGASPFGHPPRFSEPVPAFDDDSITVILRPSRKAASRSLDVYKVWDVTLTFD